MAIALFITPAYIKSVSVLDENVDEKKIRVAIIEAQEMRLHRLLGTTLYEKFVTLVNAGNVTGVYKTLMDEHIVKVVKYWTLYELAPFLAYNYRNKGIQTQNSDNSQPVDLSVVQALRDEHKDKAEWYGERMIKYLCQNSDSFPEYDNNPDIDDIQSERNNYESPIFTGNKNDCYNDLSDRYESI